MRASRLIISVSTTVAIGAGLFGMGSANAADVTLNLGYASAQSGTYHILATQFQEFAEQYTDGSVEIRLRCCTQLSTEDEAFRGMQLGTIDMYIITHSNVSPHFPLMDAFVLPYVFQSPEHARKVVDGSIGEDFAKQLYEATTVHLLTYGAVGERDFYNTLRPINEPADMDGLKIRVPKNQVMIETHRAFGAAPTPLAWSETAAALQTGTVDGGDNGTTLIKSQKFYEIADHLAILGHFSYFNPIFAGERAMNKLSDEQREAILRAAKDAGVAHAEIMRAEAEEVRAFLADEGGMQMTRPDRAPFIELAIEVQDDFAAEKGEEFQALLEEIRAVAD